MSKITKICNCCGSRAFTYNWTMRQYICDYCKNPYEKIIKLKDEPRKENTTEEGHLAIREIIGCIFIVALIIAGICGIVYICKTHPEKSESSESSITKQSVIQEPISTSEPIIYSEPANNDESKTAEDVITATLIHIAGTLLIPIFSIVLFRLYTKSLLQ